MRALWDPVVRGSKVAESSEVRALKWEKILKIRGVDGDRETATVKIAEVTVATKKPERGGKGYVTI